jgi:hypothetical protein
MVERAREDRLSTGGWTIDTLKALMDERDRSVRETVATAMTSMREQTKTSFEASEKAIAKAEEAQRAYNVSHNDLAKKLDEQNKATMPRVETENRFRAIEEKIGDLRNVITLGTGKGVGLDKAWAIIVGLFGSGAGGLIGFLVSHFTK